MKPIFYGKSDKKGKLTIFNDRDFDRYLKYLAGNDLQIEVETLKKNRSNQQNKYYWGVVIDILGNEFGYLPDEMHEALKFKFLRNHVDTQLPSVRSTSDLSTKEFEEYLENIRRWAAENGIVIPLPNERG